MLIMLEKIQTMKITKHNIILLRIK